MKQKKLISDKSIRLWSTKNDNITEWQNIRINQWIIIENNDDDNDNDNNNSNNNNKWK